LRSCQRRFADHANAQMAATRIESIAVGFIGGSSP